MAMMKIPFHVGVTRVSTHFYERIEGKRLSLDEMKSVIQSKVVNAIDDRNAKVSVCPICSFCGDADEETEPFRIVNQTFDDCKVICSNCLEDALDWGELLHCQECGEIFSPHHLTPDEELGKHVCCPYCGKIVER